MSVNIQKMIDGAAENSTITLPEGEFEGSVTINKGCTVEGNNTVLWNISGPVIIAAAENVVLRDLTVGLTGSELPPEKNISVCCHYPDTVFSGVEVNGAVVGIPDEEQYWGIPKIIQLGDIAAGAVNRFAMEFYAPVDAEISCGAYGVRLDRDRLYAGYNSVEITVEGLKNGSVLYGDIIVRSLVSGIIRRIIISGAAADGNGAVTERRTVYSFDRNAPEEYRNLIQGLDISGLTSASGTEEAEHIDIPETEETSGVQIEEINESGFGDGIREENIYITSGISVPLVPKKYCINMEYSSSRVGLDIDGYLFMLSASGKVSRNSRMIFFGNDHSDCGSVYYMDHQDKRAMVMDLAMVPDDVVRMVLIFSIYGESPVQTFDKLVNGEISILCENGVHMHLRLDPDLHSRTLLGMGFDKRDGVWEMIPSGKAVSMPIEDICRSYGVRVTKRPATDQSNY